MKIEILPQVFSCEFCKILKNIIFTEHVRKAASEQILWSIVVNSQSIFLVITSANALDYSSELANY